MCCCSYNRQYYYLEVSAIEPVIYTRDREAFGHMLVVIPTGLELGEHIVEVGLVLIFLVYP
jgi:hypothetical protein